MLRGGNHTCRDHPFNYSASHKDTVGTKDLTLDSSDQRTDFHWSNVHCLCFLAQASLFFLLMPFRSGFFAAIQPWRSDSHSRLWTVDVEMCLLLEFCEAFIWAAIWSEVTCKLFASCHNVDLVFYQIGPTSVYQPYLVTTQLIGSNALRRKETSQINF
jgi:hypothetical protein